jgi:hypothetical protein
MLYTYKYVQIISCRLDEVQFDFHACQSQAEGGKFCCTGPAVPARMPRPVRPGDPARPSGRVRPYCLSRRACCPPLLAEPACPALVVSRTTRSTSFSEQRSAGVEW